MKWIKANSGKNEDRGEYIFYLSVAMVSVGLLGYTWTQPFAYLRTTDKVGVAFFPTIFVAILLITSTMGALFKKRQKESSKPPTEEALLPFWPMILLSGGVLVGTLGFWRFDAIISCSALVLLLLFTERVRDWRLLAGITIGVGLIIYFLFIRVLGVYFPYGIVG